MIVTFPTPRDSAAHAASKMKVRSAMPAEFRNGDMKVTFETNLLMDHQRGGIKFGARLTRTREPERHLVCLVRDSRAMASGLSQASRHMIAGFMQNEKFIHEIALRQIASGNLRPIIDLATDLGLGSPAGLV